MNKCTSVFTGYFLWYFNIIHTYKLYQPFIIQIEIHILDQIYNSFDLRCESGTYNYIKLHLHVNVFICTPSCILYNVQASACWKEFSWSEWVKII